MDISVKKISAIVLAFIGAVALWTALYRVDATEVVVFQAPFTGSLSVEAAPGSYFRFGSSVQDYKKQDNYGFEYAAPECRIMAGGEKVCTPNPKDHSILVQFNDGGKAQIGGNIQWEMPTDKEHVLAMHQLYGSQAGVDHALMRNAINRAMTFTAPLMSATESYAVRRAEFLQMFADQLENGTYLTQSNDVRAPDPITGEMKNIKVVKILRDSNGNPLRAEESPLKKYGIHIQAPTITHIVYEDKVEAQIQQQRDNILAIQTAQAEAKKAEQAAITAAKNGEAGAMKAKWDQEILKAKEVTFAEQNKAVAQLKADQEKAVAETNAQRDLEVARLAAQTAEQYKIEQTRKGEGDAARKQLVMQADGALQQKIEAWVTAQKYWSDAFARYQGEVTPRIVTGNSSGTGNNAAADFMTIMGVKAANDLALDLNVKVPTAKK